MSRQALKDFKREWLKTYIEQYKTGDKKTRKAIKDNIYKNINLTENEKDEIFETIVRFGLEMEVNDD